VKRVHANSNPDDQGKVKTNKAKVKVKALTNKAKAQTVVNCP